MLDEPAAIVKAHQLAESYATDAATREREQQIADVTFRKVAISYLAWLEDVKGAKPSTLADYGYLLREPGTPALRGERVSAGHIMRTLGDSPAAAVSSSDVDELLREVAATGTSARSVNKHRALVHAIFEYGRKESTFALAQNPAAHTDKRREPQRDVLPFYSVEEVEAIARACERPIDAIGIEELDGGDNAFEDQQDATIVRVAAYAGLRLGELLALRWSDIDFAGSTITVRSALSGGVVMPSTKSGRIRRVPLTNQAARALDELSRRRDYLGPDDFVFCNALGRHLNPSALRKRYKRAQAAAGVAPLRFHDLRHTFGSLLAAADVDLVTIQAVLGHSALATTSRYLHARPASEMADRFSEAFRVVAPDQTLGTAAPKASRR